MLNVGKLVSELKQMTVTQLRARYAEVFKEQTRSFHKDFLVRRIAWRLQADAEGGLPERARRRAMEIAQDSDLRLRAPTQSGSLASSTAGPDERAQPSANVVVARLTVGSDGRLPMPGAVITREYRGKTISVTVLPKGFEFGGTVYRSLSAVAKAVTGAHWNGYLFFGITKPTESA